MKVTIEIPDKDSSCYGCLFLTNNYRTNRLCCVIAKGHVVGIPGVGIPEKHPNGPALKDEKK